MSIQDILDKKDDEISMVHQVVTHPAGFILDLFGELLYIRSHCDGFEVGWKTFDDGFECDWHKQFLHNEAMDASICFVEKRHELQCGIDFENELMKEKHE